MTELKAMCILYEDACRRGIKVLMQIYLQVIRRHCEDVFGFKHGTLR